MSKEEKKQSNLDLDPWFWASVAMILPFMVVVSVADWARELYDRTFIWGAVPENRKKKERQ